MNNKIQAKLLVIGVAFIFFAFVNCTIDPFHWGIFSRVVFGIVSIVVILKQL